MTTYDRDSLRISIGGHELPTSKYSCGPGLDAPDVQATAAPCAPVSFSVTMTPIGDGFARMARALVRLGNELRKKGRRAWRRERGGHNVAMSLGRFGAVPHLLLSSRKRRPLGLA